MIVVLDASVIVSASLKADSVPELALLRAIDGTSRIVVSQEVENEYREVISRPKFDRFVSIERRRHILDTVLIAAERVEPTETVNDCHDLNDNKYLALALAANAAVIVTGDARHLLAMNPWRGIMILRPAAYLAL